MANRGFSPHWDPFYFRIFISGNPTPMKSTNKGLYLSVPTPCDENWSQMTCTAAGRHCSSCNKTVVDFSILSDAAIFAVIANSNGAVCGRFSDDQLQRQITEAKPMRTPLIPTMAITAGLAVGIATTVHAEKKDFGQRMETGSAPASSVGSASLVRGESLVDTASLVSVASTIDSTSLRDVALPVDSASPEIRQLPEIVVTGECKPIDRTMVMGSVSVIEGITIFAKIDYDPVYYSGRHLINKFLKKKRP